jgi:hypothetical protein
MLIHAIDFLYVLIDYFNSNKKENFACQNQNCKCENLKEKNREEHTKIYVG